MTNKKDTVEMAGFRQKTHDGVDRIMDKAESIRGRGMKTMENMKGKAVKVRDGVNGYIKKNPKKTIMYAAGAGVVAGAVTTAALMRRRRKNQSTSDTDA